MFKFLTKPKFLRFIAMMLVLVFAVNVSGCVKEDDGDNGVFTGNQVQNLSLGVGANVKGYTVYSQSTFDPMTKELLMGYLLTGREFSLVVVPGTYNSETEMYDFEAENKLFKSVQMGVYEYDSSKATFVNPEKKYLLYYVTDTELKSWFNEFKDAVIGDNFLKQVMTFTFSSAGTNLQDYGRYSCEKLVNMGRGLSATDFCQNVLQPGTGIFKDKITGGMILFFGFSSIEGYITYNDIVNYTGSQIANSLSDPNPVNPYNPSMIRGFNYESMVYEKNKKGDYVVEDGKYKLSSIGTSLIESYGYTRDQVDNLANFTPSNDGKAGTVQEGDLAEDIILNAVELYSKKILNSALPGYDKTKATQELLASSLLSETNYLRECKKYKGYDCITLDHLLSYFGYKKGLAVSESFTQEDKDRYTGIYSIIEMMNDTEKFDESRLEEAFNLKLSIGLTSRYNTVSDYPQPTNLLTGHTYNYMEGFDKGDYKDDPLSFAQAQNLMAGKGVDGKTAPENADYLLLIASEGFVLDRGTSADQRVLGYEDMLSEGMLLAELVRMDACANKTSAATFFNILSIMKIVVGSAMLATGAVVAVSASIGLSVFSAVMGTLITLEIITASTGYGIIIALAIAVVIGLIIAAVGLITLIQGMQEKARIKGMGASEENYCDTYAATFNMLFETIKLTIPVYYYRIPAETNPDYNAGLSMHYCPKGYLYNENINQCESGDVKAKPISIPLYTYANVEQASTLSGLQGSPMLMYFNDGVVVDQIIGASTPQYIVEMLRLWGLLAMREIVYDIKRVGNNFAIYHTTNTNSRTYKIKGYRYCYTTDFEPDLYSADGLPNFCYTPDSRYDANDETNKNYKVIKGVQGNDTLNMYYYGKFTEQSRQISDSIPILTNGYDGLTAFIESGDIYKTYFENSASSSYKFFKENAARSVEVHTDSVKESADFTGNIIRFKDGEGKVSSEISYFAMYTFERGAGTRDDYYLVRNGSKILIYQRENGEFAVTKKVTFDAIDKVQNRDIEQFNIVDGYKAGTLNLSIKKARVDGVSYVVEKDRLTLDGLIVATLNSDKTKATFTTGAELDVEEIYDYNSIQIGNTEYEILGHVIKEVGGSRTGTIQGKKVVVDGVVVGTLNDDKTKITFVNGIEADIVYTDNSIKMGDIEYKIVGKTLKEVNGSRTGTIVDNNITIGTGSNEVRYIIGEDGKTIYLSYWYLDFVKYVLDLFTFEGTENGDALEVVLPIYFTASVKESTQAQEYGILTYDEANDRMNTGTVYKKNGGCAADEYLYFRDNDWWFDNPSKCVKDEKLTGRDRPYEATDEYYNVITYSYTSSLKVGEIVMTLTKDGKTVVTVKWK